VNDKQKARKYSEDTVLLIAAGKCWMDALELAIHCSSVTRPISRGDQRDLSNADLASSADGSATASHGHETTLRLQNNMDESECEKHFRLCGA
jgi:hypothetical protein